MTYPAPTDSQPLTIRQRLIRLLAERNFSARELAAQVGVGERIVEDHLKHIIRSLSRDSTRQFVMETPTCPVCEFRFPDRARLTKPSRCPKCKSEHLSSPRFSIIPQSEGKKGKKAEGDTSQ